MKAFFKKMESRRSEKVEKDSLMNELKSRVEDVLLGRFEEDGLYKTNDEACSNLCMILEAIFIHGIKESLTDRMVTALGDPDTMPTPEFWSPMMVFTHRDIIEQILKLKQINNDVGRSRAWLRLALNEASIIAYLGLILKQNKALARYYKKTAFLRDLELMGIAISILQGIGRFSFYFPINSSILNYWPNAPLLLAGLWTPPMKYSPVTTGLDLAKNLQAASDVEVASEIMPFDIPSTSMTNEEALEILLNTPVEKSELMSAYEKEKIEANTDSEGYFTEAPTDLDETEEKPEKSEPTIQDETIAETQPEIKEDITQQSYEKIIGNYNPKTDPNIKEASLKEFLNKTEPTIDQTPKSPDLEEMEFEVLEKPDISTEKEVFPHLLKILCSGQIQQEKGLDTQQFACKKCGIMIGIGQKKAKVCCFSGFYYCEDCFNGVECKIPSRILHNWDFTKYTISESSFLFLINVQEHPLFDIRKINSKIYFTSKEMNDVRKLRVKLNHLRLYLSTCRDQVENRIKTLLWPREYLYNHVHVFSASDLFDLETGKLISNLEQAVHISTQHVKSCELCKQKGFICEICMDSKEKSPNPIYPFEDNTHRCQICNNVVHLECYKEVKECRKCARIKEHRAKLERHKSEENS